MNDMDEVTEREGGLAPKQREVAYAIVRGGRMLDEVLEQYGVSETEFIGWVCSGQFTEYAAMLARGFAEADVAYVWKELLGLVRDGSVSAIRLYFDLLNKKPSARGGERLNVTELSGLRESIFAEPAEGGMA